MHENHKNENTSKHIKVQNTIITQNRNQCTWFTQSLGYVHKTLSHQVTYIKIKGLQYATTMLPYFLFVLPPRLSYESISQATVLSTITKVFNHSFKESYSLTILFTETQPIVGHNPISLYWVYIHIYMCKSS